DATVTGVQTCALPILLDAGHTRLKHWAVHVLLFPPSRNVTGLVPYGVVQIVISKVRISIHQNDEHIVTFPDCSPHCAHCVRIGRSEERRVGKACGWES